MIDRDKSEPRVETGVIQFSGDSPGYFLRGDDAFDLAQKIFSVEKFIKNIEESLGPCHDSEFKLALSQLASVRKEIIEDVIVDGVNLFPELSR